MKIDCITVYSLMKLNALQAFKNKVILCSLSWNYLKIPTLIREKGIYVKNCMYTYACEWINCFWKNSQEPIEGSCGEDERRTCHCLSFISLSLFICVTYSKLVKIWTYYIKKLGNCMFINNTLLWCNFKFMETLQEYCKKLPWSMCHI